MSNHAIREAVADGLRACASHCLDSQQERDAVAAEVVRRVLDVVGEEREGLCGICGYEGPMRLWPVGDHPDPLRMWVLEECPCGARRAAEHEHVGEGDEDIRLIAATPWRRS